MDRHLADHVELLESGAQRMYVCAFRNALTDVFLTDALTLEGTMTLQQLKDVITIAETGSFRKASEKLFMAQPSLTSAIKALEEELGIVIFSRSGKGSVLTADGAVFLPYARSVIMQYENLCEAYGKQERHRPRFAVSMQHYSFAVKAFVELMRQYDVENYELALRETRTKQVIEDVAYSRSDLGILYLSEFNEKVLTKMLADHALSFQPLIDCAAYVYLWKGHPLAGRESIALEDLLPYPCLSFEQGEDSHCYLAEEILSTNVYPRTIQCCDRATMLNLMIGLNGYTLCSGIICEELNGGDYVAVPYAEDAENPNSVMHIGYILRKSARLSSMAEEYIARLKACLGAGKT